MSTLSTSVTPISRATLLTRNPEASNINLERERKGFYDAGWEIHILKLSDLSNLNLKSNIIYC